MTKIGNNWPVIYAKFQFISPHAPRSSQTKRTPPQWPRAACLLRSLCIQRYPIYSDKHSISKAVERNKAAQFVLSLSLMMISMWLRSLQIQQCVELNFLCAYCSECEAARRSLSCPRVDHPTFSVHLLGNWDGNWQSWFPIFGTDARHIPRLINNAKGISRASCARKRLPQSNLPSFLRVCKIANPALMRRERNLPNVSAI